MLFMPMSEPLLIVLLFDPKRSIGLSPPLPTPFKLPKLFLVLFIVDVPIPSSNGVVDDSILFVEVPYGYMDEES